MFPSRVVLPSGKAYVPEMPVQLYQHLEDMGVWGVIRDRAPTPAVFTLLEDAMQITMHWQFFVRAINYNMSLEHVSAIFGSRRAFCNTTGFHDPTEPPKADYILRENLEYELPRFDKVRTCARSVLTGRVEDDVLVVSLLDGNLRPPLKPGRSYPARVEDVKFDDYLYNPRDNRHYFFAANIVGSDGSVYPFPNGGLYNWTQDGTPYTWLPHVACLPVRYPISRLFKLPLGSPIPSPYRQVNL